MTAQALVPYAGPTTTAVPRVLAAGQATPYDVRIARLELKAEQARRNAALAGQALDVAGSVVRHPMFMLVGMMAATNILSQTETGTYQGSKTYVLTGAQAVALQAALVTPAFLTILGDATRQGFDIASLLKLFAAVK